MSEIKSAAMIVNAKSRKGRKLFKRACEEARALPFPVDAHAVRDPDKLEETLKRALEKQPDLVILGGGDGTISGLVGNLVGTGAILGVLPLGTANSFARTLGLPLDVAGAMQIFADGRPRRIDLGKIDDRYFANSAAIGLSPRIAESVPHELKRYAGRAGYLAWAALQFVRFKPFKLVIGEGRDLVQIRATEVRISNGSFHGGAEVVPEAHVDDGEIVVEAVQGPLKRRLVKNWATAILHLPSSRPEVREFRGKSLRVETIPPLPISIDGEVLAKTPVTASVAHAVIDVMVPADA